MATARGDRARVPRWPSLRSAVLAGALLLPAPALATPTPTATPPSPSPFEVEGVVLVPGAMGLVAAPNVVVRGPIPNSVQTNDAGHFRLAGYLSIPIPQRLIVTAMVGDFPLRSLYSHSTATFMTIDPISEAALRILYDVAFYTFAGTDGVLVAVRAANQDTDFAGLDLEAAVELAQATALNDPGVQTALDTSVFTPTRTRTSTSTLTVTPTPTPTPTATVTETFLPTATPRPCLGDCDRGDSVSVDELVRGVNITLGENALADCPSFDGNGDGLVTIDELVAGVDNAISGCPPSPLLPDLIPLELRLGASPGCGELSPLLVCVANVGQIAAGSFQVSINGEDAFAVESLAAGEVRCVAFPYVGGRWVIAVDTGDEVVEGREDNNNASFDVPPPPEIATCTPTQTPTPTPSATPT